MAIIGGFDVHRAQITFDYLDTETGELQRGQIRPATRAVLADWLAQRFAGRAEVAFAAEACTGWRFVTEELAAAGLEPHLAEPAAPAAAELSPAGRQLVETALLAIEGLAAQIIPLREQLAAIGRRYPGPRALRAHYGIGPLLATIIWAELGDTRRFSSSSEAVRFAGLDVTVYSSDTKRAPGKLARQGSPELRWALFEAAKAASHASSPDHDDYLELKERLAGKRPTLTLARKLARRCHHTLRDLGDEAWVCPEPQLIGKAA